MQRLVACFLSTLAAAGCQHSGSSATADAPAEAPSAQPLPTQATALVCDAPEDSYVFFANNTVDAASHYVLVHLSQSRTVDVAGTDTTLRNGDALDIAFVAKRPDNGAIFRAYSVRFRVQDGQRTALVQPLRQGGAADEPRPTTCAMRTFAVAPRDLAASDFAISGLICSHIKLDRIQHLMILFGTSSTPFAQVATAAMLGYPQDPATAPSPNAFTPPYLGKTFTTSPDGSRTLRFGDTKDGNDSEAYQFIDLHADDADPTRIVGLHSLADGVPTETTCTPVELR